MLFPTLEFSLFALLSLSIWSFLPKQQVKLYFLIVFNLIFYSFYNPSLTLYLLGWSSLIWFSGKRLKLKYFIVGFGILQLIFWKAIDAKFINFHTISTPLGISFFTFQGLTYLFARMKLPAHRPEEHIEQSWDILKTFAFVGFFPTVLSGPILRAKYWEEQYNNLTPLTQQTFNYAITCIAVGSFYKLCLSSIFHEYVALAFSNPKDETGINLLIGIYSYTFEIYHDFAGYSLMAIGIALLYGFDIPDNFKQPYLSINIREFWQKWHISFSNWLKDYFYISLGGSRVSQIRHFFNTMIVMVICGAWHGLNAHYIIWGFLHGVSIIVFHISHAKIKLHKFISWFITFNFIAFSWVFFRTPDIQTSLDYFSRLFSSIAWSDTLTTKNLTVFLLFIFCLMFQKVEPLIMNKDRKYSSLIFSPYLNFIFWSIVFISILMLSPSGMPPFIYFSY